MATFFVPTCKPVRSESGRPDMFGPCHAEAYRCNDLVNRIYWKFETKNSVLQKTIQRSKCPINWMKYDNYDQRISQTIQRWWFRPVATTVGCGMFALQIAAPDGPSS